MNRVFIGIALLLLSACSSKPISMNYYMLHDPGQLSQQAATDISQYSKVWLRSLDTPDYLKQRNLSIQVNPSEIKYATQHAWAESFPGDFVSALTDSLFINHKINLSPQSRWTNGQDAEYILDIRLADFIATYNGTVVLKGSYRMERSGSAPVLVNFNYQLPLDQDGFSHSVEQMRALINQFASEVVSNIESDQ